MVEVALSIASYTYGGLLGSFLLGLLVPGAGKRQAMPAFFVGLVVMALFITFVNIAWPLYTVAGSAIVLLTGILLTALQRRKRN